MGIRILVVEDDPGIADFLVRGLKEEGFGVEHSADAEHARFAMEGSEWDLVILDWGLPDQDGLTVLRRFRRSGRDAPVLFLTARDTVVDRVRGLDGGADDYLCKPFHFDELLARIRALLRRRERSPQLALSVGDLHIDLAAQRAQRGGRPLDLTAKEFSLLVYLTRNPDQVLTRTRIYDHVWDTDYDGLSNTLEVHIKDLRRKLEAHGPRLIHTLRGRGYIFSASRMEER